MRRACLDHLLILGKRHRQRVLQEYVAYFNRARPHQGLGQVLPEPPPAATRNRAEAVRVVPILVGLHYTCQRVA